MAIHVVRLGTPRAAGEGPRLGTVRRPPRGVPRADFGRRDYYDVWLPDLAPSAQLVSWAHVEPLTGERWTRFAREYRKEMRAPAAERLIGLLAALSRHADFAVGCYCEDAAHCHRAVLRELLVEAGADVAGDAATAGGSTTGATASRPRAGTAPPRRRRAR
jgi:uncharacterized protein YeaO (DUF488 family)